MAYFSNFKTPGGLRCSSALPLHEVRRFRSNLHICCHAEARERAEGAKFWGDETTNGIVLSGATKSPLNSGRGNTHRIHGAAVYGNMDPINIFPLC